MHSSPDALTVVVSETAAEVLGTPLDELPPLTDAIDPDALCALVSPGPTAPPPCVTVAFDYAGLEMFVSSDNMVSAHPINAPDGVGKQTLYG